MNKIKYIFNVHRKECILGITSLFCLLLIFGIGYYSYTQNDNSSTVVANSIELSSAALIEEDEPLHQEEEVNEVIPKEEKDEKIRVDIKGQVVAPGVYEASCEDRVIDIISKAGGLLDGADTSVNNLSRRVWDEMVIIIYSKEEVENFSITKETEHEEILNSEEVKDIILNDATLKEEDIITNQDEYSNLPDDKTNQKTETSTNTKNEIEVKPITKISINNANKSELMKLTGIGSSKADAIISYRNTNGKFTKLEDLMKVKGIGEKVFAKIKDNIIL